MRLSVIYETAKLSFLLRGGIEIDTVFNFKLFFTKFPFFLPPFLSGFHPQTPEVFTQG